MRLQQALSSATATVEQRFQTTTVVDLKRGEQVLVPAGATVRGFVSAVQPAGRLDRSGSLTLSFDQIVVNGRQHPIRALATQVYQSGGIREEGAKVGTAGAVGAIVGGILGLWLTGNALSVVAMVGVQTRRSARRASYCISMRAMRSSLTLMAPRPRNFWRRWNRRQRRSTDHQSFRL